jgi:hypothetical protein
MISFFSFVIFKIIFEEFLSFLKHEGSIFQVILLQLDAHKPGNTKKGSITVPLTSCLTGLDLSVLKIKQKLSVVIQLIPYQSNRRSTVQ